MPKKKRYFNNRSQKKLSNNIDKFKPFFQEPFLLRLHVTISFFILSYTFLFTITQLSFLLFSLVINKKTPSPLKLPVIVCIVCIVSLVVCHRHRHIFFMSSEQVRVRANCIGTLIRPFFLAKSYLLFLTKILIFFAFFCFDSLKTILKFCV